MSNRLTLSRVAELRALKEREHDALFTALLRQLPTAGHESTDPCRHCRGTGKQFPSSRVGLKAKCGWCLGSGRKFVPTQEPR